MLYLVQTKSGVFSKVHGLLFSTRRVVDMSITRLTNTTFKKCGKKAEEKMYKGGGK